MKIINLQEYQHSVKIGQECPAIEPNIIDDCIFYADGEPIGFFMRQLPEKASKLADLADKLLRSKDVPKATMNRGTKKMVEAKGLEWVSQYSVILGSIPPKPHMKRPYPSRSSVHQVASARTFAKAMLLLAKESEEIIKEVTPNIYAEQFELLKRVPKEWRFANLFTSSISNFNISAPYHRDTANIKGAVNVIITKRKNSKGGNLHIPDHGATIDQCDNSILVYPAWRNVHGVTPIEPTYEDGYRNSLVFYGLNAFLDL